VVVTDEDATDLFGRKGREILKDLELDADERELLDQKLEVVDHLTEQIKVLEAEIIRQLESDPAARIVMSVPGIGVIVAYAVLAEIGEIGRFPNGRALAGYAGVLPLDDESAGKESPEHVNRRCNRYLKWALLEGVTGAIRGSARLRGLYQRVKARNNDRPGKARVAVARELAELVHYLLSRGKMYQENAPARPGSKESKIATDPNRARQTTLSARSSMSQAAS
jgi:transposase